MSAKHTRGQWTVLPEEVDRPYIRVRGTRLGERYKVANVLTPDYEGVHPREAVETRANARLIAAAPDLLDALQMAKHIVANEGTDAQMQQVFAAIEKATGEKA